MGLICEKSNQWLDILWERMVSIAQTLLIICCSHPILFFIAAWRKIAPTMFYLHLTHFIAQRIGILTCTINRPLYNPTNATLIRLAFNSTNPTGTNLALPGMYDIGCKTVFDANGNTISTNSTTSGSIPSATPKTSSGAVIKSQGLVVLFSAMVINLAWLL